MHHCRKFCIALQELFAAMQQKDRKPHYLIKIRGLWDLKVPSSMLNLAKIGNIGVKKTTRGWFQTTGGRGGIRTRGRL